MEQSLVLVSIVLGIALAFELENLDLLLRSKKVRWHWAQALFAVFVLLTIMSFWWMVASTKIDGPITLVRFLPIMWVLVILSLLAAASLPREIPEEGIDLAEYYQDNRRYFWGLYLLMFTPLAYSWVSQATDLADFGNRALGEALPLACIVLLFFAKRWWLVAVGFAGLGLLSFSWMFRTL